MTSKLKLLVTSAVASAAILGSNPAFAVGTDAGTGITNNVSVAYTVGGATQTAETDTDTFVVDRKVNLDVSASDAANTTVGPGETQAAVTFDVTNLTNDTLDLLLSVEQPTTDDFNVLTTPAITYYLDDGDGIFNGADTLVTYLDDIAEDETVTVHVVADMPGTPATGDLADIILIAQAALSGNDGDADGIADGVTVGTQGAALADGFGSADDPTVVENVFIDADGPGAADVAGPAAGLGDGRHSDTDTYEVAAADISVFKSSRVVSDPLNGTTNPKAIPGAVIEYCISVANAGPATAAGVAITDTLPADVGGNGITFVPGSILVDATAVIVAGPPQTQTCSGGSAGGSFADPTVSGALSNIASGANRAMIFQVVVD